MSDETVDPTDLLDSIVDNRIDKLVTEDATKEDVLGALKLVTRDLVLSQVLAHSLQETALSHVRMTASSTEENITFQGKMFNFIQKDLESAGATDDEINRFMYGDNYMLEGTTSSVRYARLCVTAYQALAAARKLGIASIMQDSISTGGNYSEEDDDTDSDSGTTDPDTFH